MHKESEVSELLGLKRSELKKIRESIPNTHPELGVLWGREDSNKPEKLKTVIWTDGGIQFLALYLNIKAQHLENKKENEFMKPMTKGEFDKTVNNSKWVGRVANNRYRNNSCLLIEHDIGFKVVVLCKDNKLYPRNSFVIVDSRNLRHTVRLPHFQTYEKAYQQANKAKSKSWGRIIQETWHPPSQKAGGRWRNQ